MYHYKCCILIIKFLYQLIEIEKKYLHPGINKTHEDLLKLSEDNSKVSEYGMGLK